MINYIVVYKKGLLEVQAAMDIGFRAIVELPEGDNEYGVEVHSDDNTIDLDLLICQVNSTTVELTSNRLYIVFVAVNPSDIQFALQYYKKIYGGHVEDLFKDDDPEGQYCCCLSNYNLELFNEHFTADSRVIYGSNQSKLH